ncbi:MAG: ABC transporter ATP-binding protein [Candidatus Limivicinus sp.]
MVKVEHLVKYYGEKLVLSDISFSIKEGEVVGLLGLNGAGKSTTMNILTGYLSANSGTVTIDGHNIFTDANAAKRCIGYLPELFSFYPEMRVDEYLSFCCNLKGVTRNKQEREKHLDSICRRVGIDHVRGRMIRNLSKGYKQRVGFAQALIGNPKLLVLDEPTVGLDPSQIIEIRELIRSAGKSSTVIVSSHILSEIQAVCDRVIVIHGGRVIADDTPESLSHKLLATNRLVARIRGDADRVISTLSAVPSVEFVRQLGQKEPDAYDYRIDGANDTDIRADVFHALADAGLVLLSTYSNELSLEDVFLNLVGDSREGDKEASGV